MKRFAQQGAENEATLKAITQELSKYASGKGRSAVKKALAEVPIHEQASDQAAARRRSACSGHIMDIRGIAPANHLIGIPVVPHKAVAEVSKIGNL